MTRLMNGDGTEDRPITLDQALAKVQNLACDVGEQHAILGAALILLVRCAPLARGVQHRLLTAGCAMVEVAEWKVVK